MKQFKINDFVRTSTGKTGYYCDTGIFTAPNNMGGEEVGRRNEAVALATSKPGATKVKEPKKHLYRLKKDSLEHKAGIIVKEQCTDGDQDFDVLDKHGDTTGTSVSRSLVVDNPDWFEEVRVKYETVKKRGRKAKK